MSYLEIRALLLEQWLDANRDDTLMVGIEYDAMIEVWPNNRVEIILS